MAGAPVGRGRLHEIQKNAGERLFFEQTNHINHFYQMQVVLESKLKENARSMQSDNPLVEHAMADHYTTLEVAKMLGMAVRSVQLMVDRNELEAWKRL